MYIDLWQIKTSDIIYCLFSQSNLSCFRFQDLNNDLKVFVCQLSYRIVTYRFVIPVKVKLLITSFFKRYMRPSAQMWPNPQFTFVLMSKPAYPQFHPQIIDVFINIIVARIFLPTKYCKGEFEPHYLHTNYGKVRPLLR